MTSTSDNTQAFAIQRYGVLESPHVPGKQYLYMLKRDPHAPEEADM